MLIVEDFSLTKDKYINRTKHLGYVLWLHKEEPESIYLILPKLIGGRSMKQILMMSFDNSLYKNARIIKGIL